MAKYLYGNNVLITGATSGIGLATTLLFSEKGYNVWGVSRSAKTEVPLSENVTLVKVDVTDEKNVEAEIKWIWDDAVNKTGSGIGVVIHCAGFGIGGSAEETEHEIALRQFQTNYFGVLNVNRNLLKLMHTQKRSLVLVLGSVAGRISIPFQSHYSATKFALEAYIEALRIEAKEFGIRATIIEAGDTKTPFTAKRQIAIDEDSPYKKQGLLSIKKMELDEQNGYEPTKVAKVILSVTKRKYPPVRLAVGFSYKVLLFLKRILPDCLAEKVLALLYLPKE
jgi:short-subunit dehydrogenase